MNENEKIAMSKLLKSYIEDLKEGKKPKVFEIFRDNPKIAKEIAPLIHITRLSMIKENSRKTTNLSLEKAEKVSDRLTKQLKKLNKENNRSSLTRIKPAVSFRKNEDQQDNDGKDYTSEAIEKMIEKMDNDND